MQLRKLIRLLKEAEKKVGPYAQVTLDTRRYKNWHDSWIFDQVDDIHTDSIVFVNDNGYVSEHAKERPVVVLNRY